MHRLIWFVLLLSFAATAEESGGEAQRLYAALNMLNQEQQAIYQQFQMVQELRRDNSQAIYGVQIRPAQTAGEVPNYTDVIEAQKTATRRREELDRQADRLLARYNEIEEEKKPLRQRIYSLTISK